MFIKRGPGGAQTRKLGKNIFKVAVEPKSLLSEQLFNLGLRPRPCGAYLAATPISRQNRLIENKTVYINIGKRAILGP